MICDDVLSNLETGGFAKRLQARLHLLRCRRCRQVNVHVGEFKQELSNAEPLVKKHRKIWMAVAQPDRADQGYQPVGVSARWVFAGLAAATAVMVVVGIWLIQRDDPRRIVDNDPPRHEVKVEPHSGEQLSGGSVSRELDKIHSKLVALSKELDELSGMIELMDEHKRVDDLLSRYAMYKPNQSGI